ncbi:lysostaphin resistance A-like protein [Butyrivibrio sp. JL13D10]|uniref:CPBP family intramembrane glutamic endopeptidase n=1 Tax=Butyrivibrio sp. JL13D10 TaxID=3236815 RepID=UPI0038B58BC5
MNNKNTQDFILSDRSFEGYKPFKSALAILLTLMFFLALASALILGIAVLGTFYQQDIIDKIAMLSHGYDNFNVYDSTGALVTLGTIALFIPAMFLATNITGYRPFSSYTSVTGKWRTRPFFVCLAVALIVAGIPIVIESTSECNYTGYKFTLAGLLLCLVLGPLQCIAEEYIFRGLIMQSIGGWINISSIAVLLQAIPFMFLHPYSSYGMVEVTYSGIIAGFLVYVTGGIEAGSALHIVNNMTLFLMNGLGYQSIKTNVELSSLLSTVIVDGIFFAAVFLLKTRTGIFSEDLPKKPYSNKKIVSEKLSA